MSTMKRPLILTFLGSMLLLLQGCKDIIAENIQGRTPVIIIPSNGQTVNQNPVHFKWEPMSGATRYRLQVVSPSFSNIQVYALDSVITGTEFYLALDSNDYELHLTAMNAGYTSNTLDSVYFTVGIQPSSGNGGEVELVTPADSTYYSSADVFGSTFEWEDLPNASYYEFYLKKGTSFSNGTPLDYEPHVNPPNISMGDITFTEGVYQWGVRAYLDNGLETSISKGTFFIDTTQPNIPSLLSPLSFESPGDITFTWNSGTDGGNIHAPVTSYIELAEDANFTINANTYFVAGNSAVINVLGTGQRYWRVYNKDAAGNVSSYSATASFTLL